MNEGQPNNTQPVTPTNNGHQPLAQVQGGSDTLGIISIVLDCIGLPFIGFILGLIGASKAKREGRSPTLSRVGWILGLVISIVTGIILLFTFVLTVATGVQEAANEAQQQVQQESQQRNATLGADSKLACLTQTEIESVLDYTTLRFIDFIAEDEEAYSLKSVFFISDSKTYEFAPAAPALFDDLAKLYNEFSDKNFIFALQSRSTKDTPTTTDETLADSRHKVIEQELVDRGVPSEMIESLPTDTTASGELSNRLVEVMAITNCTE